jgi:hypothetical protein
MMRAARTLVVAAIMASLSLAAHVARAQAPYAVVLPVAAKGGAIDVRLAPSRLVLGEAHAAKVTVAVPREAIRVRLVAAAGKISKISFEGARRLAAIYEAPEAFVPRVDVVMAMIDTRDGPRIGFTAVQLIGQGEAVLKTRPNAMARITIGDHQYGPAPADKRGEARIQIQVPPGTSVGYDENEAAVDLGVPRMPRVALFPSSAEIGMDAPAPVPVYAVATRSDGGADEDCGIALSVDRGSISAPRALGGGAYAAIFTPPAEGYGQAVVSASIPGEDSPAATAEIMMVPGIVEAAEGGIAIAPGTGEGDEAKSADRRPEVAHRLDAALRLGFAWNLGKVTTFDAGLDAAYELEIGAIGLRFGGDLGFSRTSAAGRPALETGTAVKVSSAMWLMPVAFYWGCRLPLAERWSLLVRNEIAGMLVDNQIDLAVDSMSLHERAWLTALGAALEVDRDLGPGAIFAGARYLWVFGDLETVEGRLATLYFDVGYRLVFELR